MKNLSNNTNEVYFVIDFEDSFCSGKIKVKNNYLKAFSIYKQYIKTNTTHCVLRCVEYGKETTICMFTM